MNNPISHKIGLISLAIVTLGLAAGCGTTAAQAPKAPTMAMAHETVVAPPTSDDPTAMYHITVGTPNVGSTEHHAPVAAMPRNTLCSGATTNGGNRCVQAPAYTFVAAR